MKQIGLIKWFDIIKGFGKIGTPNIGDVFLHVKNLSVKPEKILKGTAIVFEIQNDIKGNQALNAAPPRSYEDFELILSYLKQNPDIEVEITVTRKNRFGNDYKKDEIKQLNLINYSLHQLLKNIKATEIYEFFKTYYYKLPNKSDLAIPFFDITKNSIKNLDLELNGYLLDEYNSTNKLTDQETKLNSQTEINRIEKRNNFKLQLFLTQKLFIYYLKNLDNDLLLKIWESQTYIINTGAQSILVRNYDENYFEFPTEMYSNIDSKIDYRDLSRILKHSNGIQIVYNIINKKILNFNNISYSTTNDLLNSIQVISGSEYANELRQSFTERMLEVILRFDFMTLSNEVIENFKQFIDTIKSHNLNFESTILKFNTKTSEETQFNLWHLTKYYNPNNVFFKKFITKLSYEEFLIAPIEFHEEYFLERLNEISNYKNIENFGLLLLLLIDSPLNKLQFIFEKLELEFKIGFWLNLSNSDDYNQNYKVNFDFSNLDFDSSIILEYLDNVSSLDNLITNYELISKIRKTYYSNYKNTFNLDKSEKEKIIKDYLLKPIEANSANTLKIFKAILNKSNLDNCFPYCQKFIPKFINNENTDLNELISIVNQTNIAFSSKNQIFSFISDKRTDFEKVTLWFNGQTNNIDINKAIEVFVRFPIQSQPLLFRKLLSVIHRGNITSEEYFIDKLLTLSENAKLNLNVSICLNVIKSLSNRNTYIEEKTISEIICRFVNENVNSIIQLSDFFEKCNGRTWISKSQEKGSYWCLNIEGKDFYVDKDEVVICDEKYAIDKEKRQVIIHNESYPFKWTKKEIDYFSKLYEIPHGITFCDAVKSEEDEILKKVFYWCNNGKCFHACQTDHNHLEWSNYTLRDIIKILKLPFEEDKYYRFVGLINRANRLILKLKCESCNKLLRDVRTSEFAFYRVTTFHCTNPGCSKYHSVVYLNHCLNWKCLNIVDSRISTICPNEWYVCDKCNNCCSQEKLEKRLENLITNNAFNPSNPKHIKLKYQVDNKLGHFERNEKFDFKTGDKIN